MAILPDQTLVARDINRGRNSVDLPFVERLLLLRPTMSPM